MSFNIALAGNPNSGKTTLFNGLTGSKQYVGNWPGVTVEKITGQAKYGDDIIEITDLPGIYSLSTFSLEETIAREYIESNNPNLILNIVDASNIERNLLLTLQLIDVGKPVVVALNMMDILESRNDKLDVDVLSKELGVPVIPIVARRKKGLSELLNVLHEHKDPPPVKQIYTDAINNLIDQLQSEFSLSTCGRMHAIRFIEEGGNALVGHEVDSIVVAKMDALVANTIADINMDRDMIISHQRYKYIHTILSKCLVKAERTDNLTLSDKIDKVVTNRILAIPIFLLVMFGMFSVAFGAVGGFIKGHFEYFLNDIIIGNVALFLKQCGIADWLYSLVVDGVLGGVGSVLGFLPEITLLFIALAILEDSGYMARAAFIMDRLMRRFGLSGKSFIPMIVGFGCTVPALIATRTLESERDRRLTMMLVPFMSCGARLPIYAMFAAAFFVQNQAVVIFSIYILGIVVAVLSGILLKKLVMKQSISNFILELPEYRIPTAKNLFSHTWIRVKSFIIRAGTILLVASIIIWFMQSFNFSMQMVGDSSTSMFGVLGSYIAPVFAPIGFGDWRASMALVTGFVAKEAVVGTLGILYGVGEAAVENPSLMINPLSLAFTSLSAYSFMVFSLLYMPCIAALATLKREMNSWKWTILTVVYQTGVAWFVAFIVYRIGRIVMS